MQTALSLKTLFNLCCPEVCIIDLSVQAFPGPRERPEAAPRHLQMSAEGVT